MNKKGLKGNLWKISLFILILIFLSISLVYIFWAPLYESDNAIIPNNVLISTDKYLGKNITVKGYYYDYFESEKYGYIYLLK